jgi:OmcA/MtrC family decaheme c-type cytochrome
MALLTSVLAACGGGGSDGINGTPGTPGTTTTVSAPGIQVGALTPTQWAALQLQGQITAVSVGGPPEVTFTLTDQNGNAIVGLENNFSKAPGQALPTQRTVSATMAKLVPGTNGSPNKWVSYLVATVDPTKATGDFSALRAPNTDGNGTLTYLGGGQYKYKFATDITKVKAYVDASTDTFKADVGDVAYEPSLPHRVVLQIAGPARGTGNNTADGSTLAPAVNLENPVNLVWDSAAPQRDIVRIESCNNCHSALAFHGSGARVDTDYCVTCHTNQRKYGQSAATLGTTLVKYDDGTSVSVPSWSKEPRKFPNGDSMRDFPIMVHSIHAGERLPVRAMPTDPATGKDTSSDYIDEVKFPQPITNCASCHTGSAQSVNATPQGDNWKNVPSRKACGACHNNIDFATGANHPGVGGARPDDSQCKNCHSPDAIATVYHVSVDPTGAADRGGYPLNTAANVPTPGLPSGFGPPIPLASATNPPAGVPKVAFEISSITVASQKASIKYRILFDGTPVTFLPAGDKYLLPNVDGTPQISVTYGLPEDGVTTVADWTAAKSAKIKQCRDQVANTCTQTGPDGSGYYTATFQSTQLLPTDAKLITAALGINYNGLVKLDHPSYPKGIRLREPAFALKAASTTDVRRTVVEAARCNRCHNQLGVEPSFHSGARNNPQGCAMGGCHFETRSTGHTGEANTYGGGWALGAKNMIHAIHGASKREQPFNYEATPKNLKGFGTIKYPGILNNCEQCHVPGSYDFANTTNQLASTNLLWATDANGDMRNPGNVPPIGQSPWIKTLGKGEIDYRVDNLVSSPITSACFACHDSQTAIAHFRTNGGVLLKLVSEITGAAPGVCNAQNVCTTADRSGLDGKNIEQCLLCHATGKVADVRVVHQVRGVR